MADLRDKGKIDQATRKKLDDVSKMMKNIAKSFDGVKQESLRGLFEANAMEKNGKVNILGSIRNATKSSFDNLRTTRSSDASMSTRIKAALGLTKESEKMIKDYVRDVKQGKLYDPKKADADDMFESFGFDESDFEYDDFSYGDSSSFFSYEDEKTGEEVLEGQNYFGEKDDTRRGDALAARGIAESRANTASTNSVIASSSAVMASAVVHATEANTVATRMEFGKLQAINARGFNDIVTVLTKHEAQSNAHYNRSALYYEKQLELTSELVKLGIQGQANKTHEAYKGRQVDEDDPYTLLANGDVKGAMKKMMQQQWRSSIIATTVSLIPTLMQSMSMNGNMHTFIKEQASEFLRGRIGGMFKGTGDYTQVAKTTGNFFRHMSLSDDYTMSTMGDKLRPGVKSAETFATSYKNKTIGFDEQTHRTINIGMMRYLAEITAAVTKSEVKLFDPQTGKFRPEKTIFEEFEKNVKSQGIIDPRLGQSLAGRIGGLISRTQAKNGTNVGVGADGKIQLAKELDLIMPNLAKKGYGITALLSMSYRRFKEFYLGMHEEDFYLLKDALYGMYQTEAGKAELDAIDDRMLDAIEKRNAFVKNVNSLGSGSAYMYAMDGFSGKDDKHYNKMMDTYGEDVKEVRATRIFHENKTGAREEAATHAKERNISAFDLTFGPMIRSNMATLINTINNAKNLTVGDRSILEDIPAPLKKIVAKYGKSRGADRGIVISEEDGDVDAMIENIKSEREGETILDWITKTSNSIGGKIANVAADISDISNDEQGRKALGDTLIKGGIGGALGVVGGSVLSKIPFVRGIADTFGFSSPIVMASLGVSEAIARSKEKILAGIDDPEKKQKMESFLKGFEKAGSAVATGGMATSFMSNMLMKIPLVNGIFHGTTQVMGPFAPLFKAGLSAAIGFTLESEKVKKALFGEGSGDKTFIQNVKTKLFGDENSDGVLSKYFTKTKDFFNDKKSKFNDWFSSNVKEPFREGFRPIREIFLRRTDKMLDDTGESTKGIFATMMEKIDKKLIEPASKLAGNVFSKLMWGIGKVLSAPFKLFGAIGKRMGRKHGVTEEDYEAREKAKAGEAENLVDNPDAIIKEQEEVVAEAKAQETADKKKAKADANLEETVINAVNTEDKGKPQDITADVEDERNKSNADMAGSAGFKWNGADLKIQGKKLSEVGCAIGAMCTAFSSVAKANIAPNSFLARVAGMFYVKGVGIHMSYMKKMGDRYGVGVRYFDTTKGIPSAKSIEHLIKRGHAFIALITNDDGNHFIAVTKMAGKGTVVINDPLTGESKESTVSFIAMTKKLVLVSPAKKLTDIIASVVDIRGAEEINEYGDELSSAKPSTKIDEGKVVTALPVIDGEPEPVENAAKVPAGTAPKDTSVTPVDIKPKARVNVVERDKLDYSTRSLMDLLEDNHDELMDFLRDHLSGTGYNANYIRKILSLHMGALPDDDNKDYLGLAGMKGKFSSFMSKLNVFKGVKKFKRKASDKLDGWKGNISDFFMGKENESGERDGMFKHWLGNPMSKMFGTIGRGFKGATGAIGKGIKGGANLLGKGAKAVGGGAVDLISGLFGLGKKATSGIGKAISNAFGFIPKAIKGVGNMLSAAGKSLTKVIGGIGAGINKVGGKLLDGITGLTKGLWKGATTVAKGLWGGAAGVVKGTWKGIKAVGTGIKTVAKDTWQGAKNIGNALVGKMSKYTSDKITKVELVGGVVDTVKHVNAVAVVGAIDSTSYGAVNDEINARGKDMKASDLQSFKAEAASEAMEDTNILNAFNGEGKVVAKAGEEEPKEKKGFLETIGGIIKGLGIGLLGAALTSMVSKDAENFFKGMYDMIGADGDYNVEREQGQVTRGLVKKGVNVLSKIIGGPTKFLAKTMKTIAESNFAKSIKSAFSKNIDNIMSGGMAKGITSSLEKAWKQIFSSKMIQKVLGSKVAVKMLGLAGEMAAKAGSKAALEMAKKAGRGLLTFIPFVGQILDVTFFAYDLLTGMSDAAKLFKVDKSDVNATMRTVAGVVNAIQGLAANKLVTMLFAFIPTDWLVDIVYKAIADDEEEKELEKKRQDYLTNGGEQDGFMDSIKKFLFGGGKDEKDTNAKSVDKGGNAVKMTGAGVTAGAAIAGDKAKPVGTATSSTYGYSGSGYGMGGTAGGGVLGNVVGAGAGYGTNSGYGNYGQQQNGNVADLKGGGELTTTGSGQVMNASGVNTSTKGQGLWEKTGNFFGGLLGNGNAGTDAKAAKVSNKEAAKVAKSVMLTSGLSKEGIAAVLGNIQVESNFDLKPESLFYTSADRIKQVYPGKTKGLSASQLQSLVKNEQRLGDFVYGSMGGYKYRGRGFIQLTGKDNYAKYSKRLGVDLIGNPDLANDPKVASRIALAYMQDRAYPLAEKRYKKHINKLNLAEAADVVTRAVQGEGKDYSSGFLKKHMDEKRAAAQSQYKLLGDVKATGNAPTFVSQKNINASIGAKGSAFSEVGCGPSSTIMALQAAGFNVDPSVMFDMAKGIDMTAGMSMNDISKHLSGMGIEHEVNHGPKLTANPSIVLNRKGLGHHFTAVSDNKTYDPLKTGPTNGVDKSNIKGSISIKPPVTDSVKESKSDSGDIIKAIQMQTSAIVNSIQQLATALMNKDGGGGKGIDDVLDRNLLNIMNELSILRTGNI